MAGGAWCHHVEKPEWRGKIPCVPPSSVQVTSHTITPSVAHSCVLQKIDCFSKSDTKDTGPSIHQSPPSPDLPSPQVINNTSLCNTTHIDKTPTEQAAIDTERKKKQHANATGGIGYQSDAKGIRISRCREENKRNQGKDRDTSRRRHATLAHSSGLATRNVPKR
jgi:hypothetical protein